jgi:hypothetical protein
MAPAPQHGDPPEPQRAYSRGERFTSGQKTSAVLRLLQGESVDAVSQDLGVSIGRLERWRNEFVTAGSAALVKRKHLGSPTWWERHSKPITQWIGLLIALAMIILTLTLLLQRGTSD